LGVVEVDEDELGEDLGIDDDAVAVGGADAFLAVGEAFSEFLVGFVFVAEAAHEAAAAAGDFEGVEGGLLGLGGLHADGLQDLEEVFAAAVLPALFVVGGEAGLVAGADVLEVEFAAEVVLEAACEEGDVDAVFGEVEDGEAFAAQDGLNIHDFEWEAGLVGDASGFELEPVAGLFDLGLGVEVFEGGDAEDAALGEEGVVLAAGVFDVAEHLLAGDGLGATGVGAGGGEHLGEFGAAMGFDDEFGAAAGLGGAVVGELADHFHGAEADDDGLGGLEGVVGLFVGFEVGFELGEGEDGHGAGRRRSGGRKV
jgi:hypothetical protein